MDKVVCIYRISHKLDYDNDNVYIGSTTDLNTRKLKHKYSCMNENNKDFHYKVYQYIRENGGFDNFQFIILRVCDNVDKKELFKLEQSFIDVYEPTLNTNNASQTKKEWCEKNKEKIKKHKKEYYEKNKEELKEKNREYREEHQEEIHQRRKEYHKNNKEKINQQKKVYREENREEINKRKLEVIHCECGKNSVLSSIARHRKSKHHQEYLKFNEEK